MPWCEDTNSHISLGETDQNDGEFGESEDIFVDNSGREELNQRPESHQIMEERPLNEVPYSDHEARQALFFKPYQDIGSWCEETDSQISEDEAKKSTIFRAREMKQNSNMASMKRRKP